MANIKGLKFTEKIIYEIAVMGGPGSGHHGHGGRPGSVGGSAPGGSVWLGDMESLDDMKRALGREPTMNDIERWSRERTAPKPIIGSPYQGEPNVPQPSRDAIAKAEKFVDDNAKWTADYMKDRLDEPPTANEIKKGAQAYIEDHLKDSDIVINVRPAAMEQILKDGEIKNQHETGKSSSLIFDPAHRATEEEKGFGIKPGSSPDKYPIYGGIYKEGYNNNLMEYGTTRIYLKPEIGTRSTFTVGDSLGPMGAGNQVPSPLTRPGKSSWGGYSYYMWKNNKQGLKGAPSYLEVQIHGGVKLSDIAKVLISKDVAQSTQRRLEKALSKARISYE